MVAGQTEGERGREGERKGEGERGREGEGEGKTDSEYMDQEVVDMCYIYIMKRNILV